MRILVGTTYSGENEIEACRAALERQSHRGAEQFVVEGLGEKAAIDALWRTFTERSAEFDLFLKLDADMVLADDHFLARCVELFSRTPELDELQVAVHDYFCDELIMGLHVFRSTVRWPTRDERLFVDATPVPKERRRDDWTELAPAAWHCPDPSPLQAFHFGLHRALKVLQSDRRLKDRGQIRNHWRTLERTRDRALSIGDRRRALAVLGAESVFSGKLSMAHVDRWTDTAANLLRELEELTDAEMLARLRDRRTMRFGSFPSKWRRELLAWWCGGRPFHPVSLVSFGRGFVEVAAGRRGRDWERR